ncbi:MAG: hypothetical protein PVG14_13665 [Anaerolineales bacterium]|jgi:hypothetical protein
MREMFVVLALLSIIVVSCGTNEEWGSAAYNELTETYLEEWESNIFVALTRFPGNLEPIKRDLERISAATNIGTATTSVTKSLPPHNEVTKVLSRYKPSKKSPPADAMVAKIAIMAERI